MLRQKIFLFTKQPTLVNQFDFYLVHVAACTGACSLYVYAMISMISSQIIRGPLAMLDEGCRHR